MVVNVVIGAMGAQNADQVISSAATLLITPGDREDIVLAAAAAAAEPSRQLAGMVSDREDQAGQRRSAGHRESCHFPSCSPGRTVTKWPRKSTT